MKVYRVRLAPEERAYLEDLLSKGKAAARTLTHARILLKADEGVAGPGLSDEAIVEEAYLTALSRRPTEEEKSKIIAVLSQTKPQEKRAAIEDVYWSILSSNEFLFNH